MLEAVIFDLDGVLTETSKQHFMAWKQLAKDLGFELSDQMNKKLKGISRLEALQIVLAAGAMENKFTEKEKLALADQKNLIYQSYIKDFTKENLTKGALELLISLKENNIKTALASVSRNAAFLLKAMEIDEYFDAVADPNEVQNSKPAPDIFLAAAKKLDVLPSNCIGIEDAYAGIEAIKSAGMQPLGIGDKEELHNCKRVVAELSEVNFELLRSMLV